MRVCKVLSTSVALLAAAVLTSAHGGVSPAPAPASTAPSWQPTSFSQTIIMGLEMINETTGFISGGNSGGGTNVLKTTDGGRTFVEIPTLPALFQLGLAAQSDTEAIVAGISMLEGACQYLVDGGKRFTNSSMPGVSLQQSQDAQIVRGCGGNRVAAIGGFSFYGTNDTVNGYALSDDGGASFSFINMTDIDGNLYPSRYGAFPDCATGYITTGSWPNSQEKEEEGTFSLEVSRNIVLRERSMRTRRSAPRRHPKRHHRHHVHHRRSGAGATTSDPTPSGWSGSVALTLDGGKSFRNVLESDSFYFNQISCPSTKVCYAVGENDDDGFVYSTRDGGDSWTRLMQVEGTSLMAVDAPTESEVYVAGGVLAQAGINGTVFSSTDGGKTFVQTIVPGYYLVGIQMFGPNKGIAIATDQDDQSNVLIYA